jgi:hypothetical protein
MPMYQPIQFIGAGSGQRTSAQTSVVMTPHANTAVGDFMLGVWCRCQGTAGSPTFALGTGWSQLAVLSNASFTALVVGWKIRASGDTTYTWTASGTGNSSNNDCWGLASYRGVNTSSPFVSKSASGNVDTSNTDSSITTDTIANTHGQAWWVACAGEDTEEDTNKTWTADAGSERVDTHTTATTDPTTLCIYDSGQNVAPANYNVTFTNSASTAPVFELFAWIGLLKPALLVPTKNMGQSVNRSINY